jgi:phospholipid/cholesterol/gamma-HCH transport system substrate-binding protein
VTRSTTATLGYQGVTGIAHILLEDNGDDPTPLAGDDGELPRIAMQSSLIEELSDVGGATLRQARDFLAGQPGSRCENRQHLAAILTNLEATTSNQRGGTAVAQVAGAENLRLLNSTLAHADQAAAEAAPLTGRVASSGGRLQTGERKSWMRLIGEPSPGGIAPW